jgi:DNA polymerase-3 subunit delta
LITLIHGPAELLRAEAVAGIRSAIAEDESMIDLNTTRLEGPSATVAEIRNACDALPFLAERRLVIVEGFLRRLSAPAKRAKTGESDDSADDLESDPLPETGKAETKKLLAYLDEVPASAELVFVEDDTLGGGALQRRILELQRDERAHIVLCARPRRNDLADWVRNRARYRQVRLDASAVADLVDFIGDELRQIDQELIKLADYAGAQRTITRADVRKLVPATRAANIFELVDAMGMGDAAVAGRLMQRALDVDGEQPLRLLGMIARQYRLLLQAKELQAKGQKLPDITRSLSVPEWTTPKLLTQAQRHTFARLEWAMESIVTADEAIKTGKLSDREAMDVLLAELLGGE